MCYNVHFIEKCSETQPQRASKHNLRIHNSPLVVTVNICELSSQIISDPFSPAHTTNILFSRLPFNSNLLIEHHKVKRCPQSDGDGY